MLRVFFVGAAVVVAVVAVAVDVFIVVVFIFKKTRSVNLLALVRVVDGLLY
jgi:hypothetical protein